MPIRTGCEIFLLYALVGHSARLGKFRQDRSNAGDKPT